MSVTRFCLGKLGNITRWKVKMDEEDTKETKIIETYTKK